MPTTPLARAVRAWLSARAPADPLDRLLFRIGEGESAEEIILAALAEPDRDVRDFLVEHLGEWDEHARDVVVALVLDALVELRPKWA